ncbi:UNVERIFIED_CONTAM: hypothetical protein FKN15_007846 [Acipenser sinensis]
MKRDTRMSASQSLISGGVAGVFSRTATSPLDVVKIVTQVGTFHSKRGFVNTFHTVYREEGLRAFWKGNYVACIRIVPYSAVQLATYNRFIQLHMDDLGRVSQWRAVVAGSVAGIVAALVIYPSDVIKTRLIVQNSLDPAYRSVLHALRCIYRKEGFLALYRGASLTVMGKQSMPIEQAQSPVLPHYGGVDVHFTGMVDCFRQVVKAQGFLGLWNGLTANLLKIVPYFGLMFSSFEFCKRVCLYKNGYIVSPLSYQLAPGVDQSLGPHELRELRRLLRNRSFKSEQSTVSNRW